jgi:L,D-peptidoglycan transpeptidase YkuD (ErfK/YbiS/YcfS/YnhG family)
MSGRKAPRVKRRPASKSNKIHMLNVRFIGRREDGFHAYLQVGAVFFKCYIGKNGLTFSKREGDLKSPKGRYKIIDCLFRIDKVQRTLCNIPQKSIRANFTWCDDPESFQYNRFHSSPQRTRHEYLWRTDDQYDYCLPLNYNMSPTVRGRGSAIFLHVAGASERTAGCIALDQRALRKTINRLSARCVVVI